MIVNLTSREALVTYTTLLYFKERSCGFSQDDMKLKVEIDAIIEKVRPLIHDAR